MADFQLRVTADTQKAEKDLQRVDKTANEATKERKLRIDVPSLGEINKNFTGLSKEITNAANNIKTFYKVSKNLPGIGDQIKRYESAVVGTAKLANTAAHNTKAGDILANSFGKANSVVGELVNKFAKLGFALFGIKEIVGVLQQAFGGFFQQTIGREIKLRETILKTQTTLASTSKVFKNGREITDPYEKIVSLTGAVRQNIDSIRQRSIELAGVTSNDVIEVFGIVASQISQIGGGLKDAEDLAINFAAALGTFGIPLYQARQEIGSILRGDITMDSYLAKALGITNEDVAKAKSQAGGLIKFLDDRLAAAVAGQKIAAQGFSGVLSNIVDLWELVGQRFGAQLLDPLVNALAAVFNSLFKIREQIFSLVDAAGSLLARFAAIGREIRSRAGLVSLGEIGLPDQSGQKGLNDVKDAAQEAFVMIEGAAQRTIGTVVQIITTLKPAVMTLVDAFVRLGKSFLEVRVSVFETLARALANVISFWSLLIQGVANLFNIYTRLLDLPVLQYFAELTATMNLLKRAGMDFVINAILIGNTLIRVVVPALGAVGTTIGVLIAGVGAVVLAIGKFSLVVGALAASLATLPAVTSGVAKALSDVSKNLSETGNQAVKTGVNLEVVSGGFKNLGQTAKLAAINVVKSIGVMLLVQAAITVVVDAIGRFQKAAEEQTRSKRAELALERLSTVYRNVGDDADYATKAARDFERQLAQAEYNRTIERLEEIRKKLNDIQYESKAGIQTWSELWRVLQQASEKRIDPLGGDPDVGRLIGEEARLRAYLRKYEAEENKKSAEQNIKIEAQNRKNLEQQIKDIRIQQENELFQQRQALAQKEVDIFRAAGELRIFQMEQANKKLIEGEEGASSAALSSLNEYLSIRERGELEIETAKKQLVIEVVNLERQISDYRLENEKKIAEIRKRAGENEQKIAEYNRQIAGQPTGGALRGGAVVTQRNDRDGEQTGSDIVLAGGRGAAVQNPFSNLKITAKGFQGKGSGSTGRGFGNYVTGTVVIGGKTYEVLLGHLDSVAVNVGDVLGAGGVIGTQGITGRATGPHVTTHVNALNGGNPAVVLSGIENAWTRGTPVASAGQAITPPKLQNFDDIGAPAVEKYAAAVRSVASAMERLRTLQAALTEAKTKAAFEEIAKAAFPRENVEQYQDALLEAQLNLQALANTKGVFDPEKAALEVSYQKELIIMEREHQQILDKAAKTQGITQAELRALEQKINEQIKQRKADLAQVLEIRRQTLAVTKAQQAAENARQYLQDRTKDLSNQTSDLRTRTYMQLEGFKPEDIELQMQIVEAARQYQEKINPLIAGIDTLNKKKAEGIALSPQELLDLQNLKSELAGTASQYNVLIQALRDYATAQKAAKDASDWQAAWGTNDDVTGGMQAGVMKFAESLGTLKDNIADFTQNSLRSLSDAFVELFTTGSTNFSKLAANILADMTRIIFQQMVLKNILGGLFGGPGFSPVGGGLFGFAEGGVMTSSGPLPLRTYASGGVASSPQLAVFGEGRRPEAYVPLPDGRNIPVKIEGGQQGNQGNPINVSINVDAQGTAVQGNSQKGEQLARAVSQAVQDELIKQRRPGGILADVKSF